MFAIVYANLDGSARNDRFIRYETDVINNSEVAPEIELVLLVFSLKNRIRCFEINVFQIELVHSVFRFRGWWLSLDLLGQPLLMNSLKKSITLFYPFLFPAQGLLEGSANLFAGSLSFCCFHIDIIKGVLFGCKGKKIIRNFQILFDFSSERFGQLGYF